MTDEEYGLESLNGWALLACMIYGECRSCCVAEQVAVGNVAKNRLLSMTWYGKTWKEVLLKPKQFSCFNDGDPNRPKMLQAWHDRHNNPDMRQARCIAHGIMNGDFKDNTKGANHYHHNSIKPKWSEGQKPVVVFEHHVFYKL